MRSAIDWNEIVPLLKKDLRDTLMLEAVILLTQVGGPVKDNGRARSRLAPAGDSKLDRQWLREGDGQVLSAPGRRYRVNKTHPNPPRRGKIGGIWKKLVESKNDAITYEGLASICKGEKLAASAAICQLWERGYIDVERVTDRTATVEGKKIAVAY